MKERRSADQREEAYKAMRTFRDAYGDNKKHTVHKSGTGAGVKIIVLAAALAAGVLFFRYGSARRQDAAVSVGDISSVSEQDPPVFSEAADERENVLQETYRAAQKVRVLLMNSGFSSIYHDRLVLDTQEEQVEITAAKLQDGLDELCRALDAGGILLEQADGHYLLRVREAGDSGEWDTEQNQEGQNMQRSAPRLKLLSVVRACGAPSYRGTIEIYVSGEKLVLVNELLLEEYLYGVLPSEMPSSYHEEALKAQAVCARTFACAVMENPRYPDYNAQLDDSTSCQVYGNLPEDETAMRAVDGTRGEILLFGGKPVSTYYYSTSCGIGSDIGVWQGQDPADYPYLQCRSVSEAPQQLFLSETGDFQAYLLEQHRDYECEHPWYRWECTVAEIDADLIYQKLKERRLVKKESVQAVISQKAAQEQAGQMIETDPEREIGHPGKILELSVVKRNDAGCAVCLYIEGTECSYLVWGEYNIRYVLCDGHTQVRRQDGSSVIMSSILPSAYIIFIPIMDKGELIGYSVKGGGYGHGVGLSQNGANIMASRGMSYREILSFFYGGTRLAES